MSYTVTSDVNSTITIGNQQEVKIMWEALDYAINNSESLTTDQKTALGAVRDSLRALFQNF